MKKIVTHEAVKDLFFDGMTLMCGGFMSCGTPEELIDLILELGTKDITLICNDAGTPERGVGRLVMEKRIGRLLASHIGLNPEAGVQMHDGTMDVTLIPQGTLAEQIRAGGFGLGGILTPTGIGTVVEEGKQIIEVDGKSFILEKPLKADVSIIRGSVVDMFGNTFYRGTTQNFNTVMATAAEKVIVEAEKLVPVGALVKESIHTPGVFVDYVVKGGGEDVY